MFNKSSSGQVIAGSYGWFLLATPAFAIATSIVSIPFERISCLIFSSDSFDVTFNGNIKILFSPYNCNNEFNSIEFDGFLHVAITFPPFSRIYFVKPKPKPREAPY